MRLNQLWGCCGAAGCSADELVLWNRRPAVRRPARRAPAAGNRWNMTGRAARNMVVVAGIVFV